MGIGERIWGWLKSLDFFQPISTYYNNVKARQAAVQAESRKQQRDLFLRGEVAQAFLVMIATESYILFGDAVFSPQEVVPHHETLKSEIDLFSEDPSKYLADKLGELGRKEATREVAESFGALVMDPVVQLFEEYAALDDPDPHEFSRSFHGFMLSLSWSGGVLDSVLKSLLGERAPKVSDALNQMYWSLGLGFLGWQTLAPLLSAGLQPSLERHYNRLYRPARFNASEVRDLFALGRFSANDVQEYLKDQGWRDQDIQTWIDLSYRNLSEGTLWELFHKGVLTQDQIEDRLYAHGYNPDDIPLLFKANEKADTEDAPRYLTSTAKNSFKNGLISEDEFRQIMTDLDYAPREIDLQVQLLTTEKEVEARDLSTSQVKALYNGRIIGKDEAKHNLTESGYSSQVADNLIQLWDQQNVPKAARINKSTITEAYTWGVLSRGQAKEKLQAEAGYSGDQAELILKIEDAQLAGQETPETVSAAALSLSTLRLLVEAGLMSRDQFEARPELERFTPEDRQTLATLYFLVTPDAPPELGEGLLAEAYVFGLLTREELAARLEDKGLPVDEIETFIRLVELDNPSVFGEFTERFIRLPNPSQLQLALQRGLIDEDEFRGHLQRQGYSLDAVEIYLFNAQYQAPAEPRQLSTAQILDLYEKVKITRQNALQRLVERGYTLPDAQLLIEREELFPEDTEIGQALLGGFIDVGNALFLLGEAGFSPEDLDAFAARVEAGLV